MIKNHIKSIIENFPALALFYCNTRDLLDQRHPAGTIPWGFPFAGHDAMAAGTFELEETSIVRKLLADVNILVSVGANVGYYCCHAHSMGKSDIAVDPNRRDLHYLLKNIKNNGWERHAEVYPVAMGTGANILQMLGRGLVLTWPRGGRQYPKVTSRRFQFWNWIECWAKSCVANDRSFWWILKMRNS